MNLVLKSTLITLLFGAASASEAESFNSCESGMFAEHIPYGRRGRGVTFEHFANNALCTDRDHNPYQFGELHGVRTYSDCAAACVSASNQEGTLHELRGVDYDCHTYKCHCLHDAADEFVGVGPYRAQGGLNNQGTGQVKNSMWTNRWACGTITSDNNYEFAAAEDLNLKFVAKSSKEPPSSNQRTCHQGEIDGKRMVNDKFRNNCNNALDRNFVRNVNRQRDRQFGNNSNWQDRAYNKCAQDAIQRELDHIGRQCRNSSQAADDCNELGREAARVIVRQARVCDNKNKSRIRGNDLKQFQRSCRNVAYGVCSGFIWDAATECGGRVSLDDQARLQRKCQSEVNSLTGGRGPRGELNFMNAI